MIPPNKITEVTRRSLFDEIALGGWNWSGRLSEVDFLARIYDLKSMRANDYRFRNAYDDIYQHRITFLDWPEDWIFSDARFDLLFCSDETLISFLTAMVHPIVRDDSDESRRFVALMNRHLSRDGVAIAEIDQVSGRPVFGPSQVLPRSGAPPEPTGWAKVDRQINEAQRRLSGASTEEQLQAVGLLCREVLITVAQHVFTPDAHWPKDVPLPSKTDARAMLESFFSAQMPGSSHEEARAHGKAALKLALALQHHRHPDPRMAASCYEGTVAVVNLVRIWATPASRV
ncbi:MAG TPA: hypothetical protein VFQ84_07565 [Arenimonas sp.]|uniref:AbiJ-related protein n=1 Tax=Arenimonas sp. TaxID=1872635 RepID=UPI002D7ED77C|nr:hypothetical protein [Arenimonas sp.]HEU0153185.1 hypothetical protein [Arenimonas sp.]